MAEFSGGASGGATGAIGGALFGGSPVGLGLGVLQGLGGLFGGSKTQTNQSAAYSGLGNFMPENNFDFSYKKSIDLKDPATVAVLAGLVLVGVYAWKKVK